MIEDYASKSVALINNEGDTRAFNALRGLRLPFVTIDTVISIFVTCQLYNGTGL